MGQENYPVAENLEDYFDSLGIIKARRRKEAFALMRLDLKAAAAIAKWEKATGWKPFLGQTEDTIRYFDPPGADRTSFVRGGSRNLWLDAGLIELTTLRTGVSSTDTGTLLTADVDYRLWPYNAAEDKRPYECVEFNWVQRGAPRSIKLTGKFGFWTDIDDDVWDTILKYGAWLGYQELALSISKGLYSVRDLNFELRYAGANASPLKLEADGWNKKFRETARDYVRVEL